MCPLFVVVIVVVVATTKIGLCLGVWPRPYAMAREVFDCQRKRGELLGASGDFSTRMDRRPSELELTCLIDGSGVFESGKAQWDGNERNTKARREAISLIGGRDASKTK